MQDLFEKRCQLWALLVKNSHDWTILEIWDFLGTADWDIDENYDKNPLDDQIRDILIKTLELTNYNQKKAAEILGITPRKLNYKIKMNNIKHPSWSVNK